jgi:hypothetical protein
MSHKLTLTVPLHWRARWRNSPGTVPCWSRLSRIFEKHRIFLLSCSVNRPSMSLDRQGPSSEIWVSMSQRSRPTSHSVSIGSEPSNAATRGGQRCDVMPTVGREAPDPVVKGLQVRAVSVQRPTPAASQKIKIASMT